MDIILQDLVEIEPVNVSIPTCPYRNNDTIIMKMRKIKEVMLRANRLKRRTLILYCYFLFGQLLESVDITRAQRMEARQRLTTYQYVVAIRVYRIFEQRRDQIFRTKCCSPKSFHRLSSNEVILLCALEENIFTGDENLEGEN